MEEDLQYAWQHKLYPEGKLQDTAGNPVSVLSPGWINHDAGPDFFNAKIVINGQEWAGNVEVHMKSSDWYRHGHQHNPAYDSVILHVVDTADTEVTRQDGTPIPQLELHVTEKMARFKEMLMTGGTIELPCADMIPDIPRIYLTDWITALGYERIYSKTDRLEAILSATGNNWEETLYIILARALGFGKNSDQFERLARSMPLCYLRKHRDSITALESMLFGQSALLDYIPAENEYAAMLQREYLFYARKFSLERPEICWQTGRMRPQNLPHRRIAMLAALLHEHTNMFSEIISADRSVEQYKDLFDVTLSPFWSSNYNFATWHEPELTKAKGLSHQSVNTLIINAVVPLLHSYGTIYNKPALRERAIDLLESLPAEKNSPVEILRRAGFPCGSAFESQGCLQLRKEYCENRKCLRCRIGLRKYKTQFPNIC
ncbi:MAG: DUF2851 family protein [Muribaculaceae bacterium]|nr:DUF2851 family protein [Muribaculaceae bacterium]